MALSQPRAIFGIHSVTPYNRDTGAFYGILKVLAGSSLTLSGEIVELKGGSSKYSWAVEDGSIDAEMSLKPKEYPDFLFELFLGKAPTAVSSEASGNVGTLTDKYGNLVDATGIATVTLKSGEASNLKFGKYVVKAVSATTVDVFFSSDADIDRGTDGEYQSDALKITASPLTITSATAVTIPNFGLELTGGAGTIAMTTGHTATFEVRPVHTGAMEVTIGATTDTFPEFGAILMAKKRGNGELFEIDCFRCKGVGLPLGLEENAWSESEIKVKVFYDSTKSGIMKIRHVKAS